MVIFGGGVRDMRHRLHPQKAAMASKSTKARATSIGHHNMPKPTKHHPHSDPAIKRESDRILRALAKLRSDIMKEMEHLATEVAETKGIMASSRVLIEGFAAALKAAGADPVKLAALRSDLDAGSSDLAAGIAANPLPDEVVVPDPVPEPA